MIDPTGIDLDLVISAWFGPPTRPSVPIPETAKWLPRSFQHWYESISERSVPVFQAKRLLINEMSVDSSDGLAIFMEDAGGDWLWALKPGQDVRVYDKELADDDWQLVAEDLDEFLVHNTLDEMCDNRSLDTLSSVEVPAELMRFAISPMEQIDFQGWRWPIPGYRLFMGDGLVARVIHTNDNQEWASQYYEVAIAAIRSSALDYLEKSLDKSWLRSVRDPRLPAYHKHSGTFDPLVG